MTDEELALETTCQVVWPILDRELPRDNEAIRRKMATTFRYHGGHRYLYDTILALIRRVRAEEREAQEDAPAPIGTCPKCGAAIYTHEGFCGGCHA